MVSASLLLAYMVIPHMCSGRDASIAAARADISTLATMLDAFHLDCGRFPTTTEGLNAMISQPTNLTGWRGPYLKDYSNAPVDPWGHPYVYVSPGMHHANGFDLYSLGHDTGDSNYLNNWNSPHATQ